MRVEGFSGVGITNIEECAGREHVEPEVFRLSISQGRWGITEAVINARINWISVVKEVKRSQLINADARVIQENKEVSVVLINKQTSGFVRTALLFVVIGTFRFGFGNIDDLHRIDDFAASVQDFQIRFIENVGEAILVIHKGHKRRTVNHRVTASLIQARIANAIDFTVASRGDTRLVNTVARIRLVTWE